MNISYIVIDFLTVFFMFSRIVFHLVTRPCTTSREKGQIHKKKAIEGHEWILQGPLCVLLRTSMTYLSPFLSQLGSSKRIRDCFLRSQYVLDNGYQTCTVGLVFFAKHFFLPFYFSNLGISVQF